MSWTENYQLPQKTVRNTYNVRLKFLDRLTVNLCFCSVLVAEKVVKVAHPYLGEGAEIRLWNPLEDADDLKAMPAPHSAIDDISASVSIETPDPIIYCVKKQPSNPICSLPGSNGSEDSENVVSSVKNPSVENVRSQTDVQAVPAQQVPSRLTSNADNRHNRHLECLPIIADTEVEFSLLKMMLDSGFAHKHGCTFTADKRNWTITLSGNRGECINLLAEEIYGYKQNGVFEVEVHLSSGLAQLLYTKCRQWLCDRLRRKMTEPVVPKMANDGRLVVAALSQDTATLAAQKLRACLLRGKVPLTDQQHKYVDTAKFKKKLKEIMTNKVIVVNPGARGITVDGLPRDVICAVSEIDQCLYKHG